MTTARLVFACALSALCYCAHAAPSAATCASVTVRAPCGQPNDSPAVCQAKGCCFNAAAGNNSCFYPNNGVPITKVIVVQSNHFDAGYMNTTTNILNLWFDQFFPRAYELGQALDARGGTERLRWMAQSWVVDMYVHCTLAQLHCPSEEALSNFTKAVAAGYITWHAYPFNAELELADEATLRAALNLTWRLDDEFGLPHKTVLSQRDVPGTTRSALRVLASAGVRAVSIGANNGCSPAAVPRAFVWQDAAGTRMPTLYHPYGYGGIGTTDAVVIPGSAVALVMDWRGDNAGPPMSVDEVVGDFATIQSEFPGAAITAGTFDEWADAALTPANVAMLPTITQEMGDTWIHGATADPIKMGWWRKFMRLRAACIASGACSEADPALQNATRLAMKAHEHTFGIDSKRSPADFTHYKNSELQQLQSAPNFQAAVYSWYEQRDYSVYWALAALPLSHPLYMPLQQALQDMTPGAEPDPAADGYEEVSFDVPIDTGRFTVTFDSRRGGISALLDAVTGASWAIPAANHTLASLSYLTYTEVDFNNFITNYSILVDPLQQYWFLADYGRPNETEANPEHMDVYAMPQGLWVKNVTGAQQFLLKSTWDSSLPVTYGTPSSVWTTFVVPANGSTIDVTVAMFNKTATRIGEGMFLHFNVNPAAAGSGAAWSIDKLGSAINPYDVMINGNHHQHGTLAGVTMQGSGAHALTVVPDETPLVTVGQDVILPSPVNDAPDPSLGVSFVLVNNAWDTNYPLWFPFDSADANIQWHFAIQLS